MNKLKHTKVSTMTGTLLLVAAAVPLVVYTFVFKMEKAKLHNGPETSPQFVVTPKEVVNN